MFDKSFLTKKAILKCSQEYKTEFKNSKCSVTISVGQPPHEGEKFKSTLIAVNDSFNECTIMVCDSLQRHTLRMGTNKNIEQVHEEANLLGEEWLKRNYRFIKQLDISCNVIRWDYWLNHSQYVKARKLIEEFSITNDGFYNAIEMTALSFLERNLKKVNEIEAKENILNYSRAYLKEECAVMLIWAKYKYQFEVYPSQRNAAMDFVYKHIISKTNPKLVREISIKFKNLLPNNSNRFAN